MIPTLDEQPEEDGDVEDGIVLAHAYPNDFQLQQSRNGLHSHLSHDHFQGQYALRNMGMMGMVAPPPVVMSYSAPLRPRCMPLPLSSMPHSIPLHSQMIGSKPVSMDLEHSNPLLTVDDGMRFQSNMLGLGDDLVRSHSPNLINGINSFFADDPQ
jgi:hypothetical protein